MKFEEWLSQQDGIIEVDCGCVTTEAFYHWMRAAYEAGSADSGPQSELVSHLSRICAESYQVVGALSEALNIFNDIGVIKALDNLSAQELIHNDVLPFSVPEAAPPAPVVPDDVLDALRKVARIRLDLKDFDGDRRGITDCLCDAVVDLIERVNLSAAMIHAGNSQVITDGWIPVSERMPEIRKGFLDTTVIIADGEPEGSEALYCIDGKFRWGRDEVPVENVTHWMPLPAAPKQDDKA